ncbi:hypothetical protein P8452_57512 [Trifolium repens]|nr:hypothetical protein P8452_57512 [Trifolium repens]
MVLFTHQYCTLGKGDLLRELEAVQAILLLVSPTSDVFKTLRVFGMVRLIGSLREDDIILEHKKALKHCQHLTNPPSVEAPQSLRRFHCSRDSKTTTSEAFRFIPTPGFTLSRQFQQGPPQHTTHDMERDHRHQDDEQEHEEENQEVDEEGEIEKDGEEDNHDKDTCGKVIIRPICNGFTPADVAAAAIRRVIEKTFPDNITCYSEVKDKAREVWFERFRTRSERMKINRASSKGGALHTTGRKAHHDIALDMNAMLGRPVHPDELFVATHKKRNGEWVDRRSEKTHANRKLYSVARGELLCVCVQISSSMLIL